MIDDRSHTYLIKWLPPEVNVILRRSRHASRDKMYQATKILPRVIITYGACARGGGRRPGFEAKRERVGECEMITRTIREYFPVIMEPFFSVRQCLLGKGLKAQFKNNDVARSEIPCVRVRIIASQRILLRVRHTRLPHRPLHM